MYKGRKKKGRICWMMKDRCRMLDYLVSGIRINIPKDLFIKVKPTIMSRQISCFGKMGALWLISGAMMFSSCYTYKVATQAQKGSEAPQTITAHSLFWGLVQKPADYIHTPVCDSLGLNGVAEVTVKTNFGYALITVVTLGIWSPVKIQYKCSKPFKKTGVL